MTPSDPTDDDALVRYALTEARETRSLRVGGGTRHDTAALFEEQFGRAPAVVVADTNTLAADPQIAQWLQVAQAHWGAAPNCPSGLSIQRAQWLADPNVWAAAVQG